jgi:hypothetical protein
LSTLQKKATMHVIKSVLFAVSVLTLLNCPAQQFNVSWGDDSKISDDYEDAVQLSNGNYLLLKQEKLKMFKVYNTNDLVPDPSIMLVGPDMKVIREAKLAVDEKNEVYHGLERYGNSIFLLYEVYDPGSKSTTLWAIRINEQTLGSASRQILGTYDSDNRMDQADINLKVSGDSSKILLFVEGPDRKKENKKYYISVLDNNLKKLWSRYIELPIGDRSASIYDQDITNEGKVFVAIKHYDREVTRETVREDGDKIPSYKYKLLVHGREGAAKEITFDLNNNFIQGTKLVYGKNGLITAAGFYKKKHNGNIAGAFYTVFDSTAKEVKNTQMATFSPELLALVDNDGYAKKDGSDPGLRPEFRINQIISRNNGTVDLISEYYEYWRSEERGTGLPRSAYGSQTEMNMANSSSRTEHKWIYGDIVNINIDKDGKTIFTRVPKRQEGRNINMHLGYTPIVHNDKLIFFYNDDEDNMNRDPAKYPAHYAGGKKAVFAAAVIDAKGNLSRQPIYSYRDEKQVALPGRIARISDTKYLLTSARVALFSSRTRFGVLEIR